MGQCFSGGKDVQELEENLKTLLDEKKQLERQITENSSILEDTSLVMFHDCERVIEKEQYITGKIFEFFQSFIGIDIEVQRAFSMRISELSQHPTTERMVKYTDIKYGQSEEFKKYCKRIDESNKKLIDIITQKYKDIDERIETTQRIIKEKVLFYDNFKTIKDNFNEIPKGTKLDFDFSIEKLLNLLEIEKELFIIEKSLPELNGDTFVILKLKEIESNLSELTKSSIVLTKCLEARMCETKSDKKKEYYSMNSTDINLSTYVTIAESIIKSLNHLRELESFKEEILKNNEIDQELQELDGKLMNHFLRSGNTKEAACSRLNRVSRRKSETSLFLNELLKHIDIHEEALPKTVRILKEKTIKFLKNSEDQDKMILDMTEKFLYFEKTIDEIELKIDEMISAEIKDLYKTILHSDITSKSSLDELKQLLTNNDEESSKDFSEHITSLLKKIELTPQIEIIRANIRDSQIKEATRLKLENKEKINELMYTISSLENEKSGLENLNKNLKGNSDYTSQVAKKMIKNANEKEAEIIQLKNHLATRQEEYDQIAQELNRLQNDIDDITKENREIKKNLRSKENELNELKERVEKNDLN